MLEPETILAGISETIRSMVLLGIDAGTVNRYIQNINDYMQNNDEKRLAGVHGFYGVFDVYGGRFLTGDMNWIPPVDYDMEDRIWYRAAVEANGDIGVTPPYFNISIGRETITFVRRIFNNDNKPLGIICLNIFIDRVKQHAINTQFAEEGYGFLLNQNLELIAHPDPSMLGTRLRNVKSYIAAYENELIEKGYIYEVVTTDYRGIKSIVFIQKLHNGWYMGVVTPRDKYYQSKTNMAIFLTALGAALAAILITILTRIFTEKNKADERMRIMFDAMPLGANLHNKDYKYFDCNASAVNMFGLSNKQEYSEKFFQLSPEYQPDGVLSRNKIAEVNEKVFAEGYCRFEWMHQKLNGEPIPCEVTLVRVEHNREFIVAAYMRDLREIKEADEQAHIMFDSTPLGACFWSKDYRVIDCNQESLRLFDIQSKKEYLDKFFDLSPEYQPDGRASQEKGIEFVKKAFAEGYCRFEWTHQKLNGEPIPCEVTLIRVKYKDGYTVVGYTRDLREQKTMLAEIYRESERSRTMAHWYNSILNAIPLPISVTASDTKWTFINAAVEKFLGITIEDALGKPCNSWGSSICNTPDCGIACAKRGLKQTYFTKGDSSYQIDVTVLKDFNDTTMGYIEVVQDITNLKLMAKKQADAEAANLAKSTFLAKVSHEVRTPMNAILGITEIQLQDEMLPQSTKEALGSIYNSGYLLLGIINDILDLSKIEAGKLELAPVNYDVPSLINDTVHLNVMRYDSKPIEFNLQLGNNIPTTLFGDELRIKQVLNNLLSNAFKYTNSGKVTLSVTCEAQQGEGGNTAGGIILIFRVTDTGQGMSAEQLNKLFEEYTRFNTEANRTTVGTGLGMAITKYLVQMMNGTISVESELGKGSVFTVRMPQGLVEGSGVLDRELAENLKQFRLGKAEQMKKAPQIIREYMPYGKILVVDDVETNLYVAKGLLAPYGLTVETARSGKEAIEKIKSGSVYDIIFMDHFMPVMDGIVTTKKIRELGYKQSIVALTANALTGQAEMFMENGFDDFISKPIDIRQLNATLNKLIRDKYPAETVEAARKLKENNKFANGNFANGGSQPPGSELKKMFSRDAEKVIAALETLQKKGNYGDEDINTYIINVHAMKSALANIGETTLSDIAMKLEQAGREKNTTVMSSETQAFIDSLRLIVEQIKQKNVDNGGENTDADDKPYLKEKLTVVQEACAEYNKKAAKDALAELRQKTWSRPVNELLDAITERLIHSEFSEAADLAKNYKDGIY